MYFNGLRAFIKYIPAIWRKLKKVDGFKKYRNQIALDIINKAGYNLEKDTVHNRKLWARKKKSIIEKVINEVEKIEKAKRLI